MDALHELNRAAHHVVRARLIVAQQLRRVAELKGEQVPSEDAERQLEIYLMTLACLEAHERLLRDEVEGKDKTPQWLHLRIQGHAL